MTQFENPHSALRWTLLLHHDPGHDHEDAEIDEDKAPPLISPNDVTTMSPSEVAYWILVKGGSNEFDRKNANWRPAFDELTQRLVKADMIATGRRFGKGLPEEIPAHVFRGIRIDYPYQVNLFPLFSGEPYMECVGIGGSDALFSGGHQPEWTDLRIGASDVLRFWPFSVELKDESQAGAQTTSLTKRNAGRKPKFAQLINDALVALFEYHDDLRDDDPEWRVQADIEKAVFEKLGDKAPSAESTVRQYVSQFIADREKEKAAHASHLRAATQI